MHVDESVGLYIHDSSKSKYLTAKSFFLLNLLESFEHDKIIDPMSGASHHLSHMIGCRPVITPTWVSWLLVPTVINTSPVIFCSVPSYDDFTTLLVTPATVCRDIQNEITIFGQLVWPSHDRISIHKRMALGIWARLSQKRNSYRLFYIENTWKD